MGPREAAPSRGAFFAWDGACDGPTAGAGRAGRSGAGGGAQPAERKRPASMLELGLLHEIKPNVGRPEWLRHEWKGAGGISGEASPKGSPGSRKRVKRASWGVSLAIPSETPPVEVIQGRLYIGTRAQAQNWTLLRSEEHTSELQSP